jgi:hypothetical protein
MGDFHDSLLLSLRRKVERNGFRVAKKGPMPSYRPDLFAQKLSNNGRIIEEIIVEAEIKSSLFLDHSLDQLEHMDDYIRQQKRKRIKVTGFLVVPDDKSVRLQAKQLLDTLESTCIKLLAVSAGN